MTNPTQTLILSDSCERTERVGTYSHIVGYADPSRNQESTREGDTQSAIEQKHTNLDAGGSSQIEPLTDPDVEAMARVGLDGDVPDMATSKVLLVANGDEDIESNG